MPDGLPNAECGMSRYANSGGGQRGISSVAYQQTEVCPAGRGRFTLDVCPATMRAIEAIAI